MKEGWHLALGRGVMHFGIFLTKDAERVAVNRACFTRLRDSGYIEYVPPDGARITEKGLKVASLWRSESAAHEAG
jgi:Mn-dependent DtxR family transcriptional regulator